MAVWSLIELDRVVITGNFWIPSLTSAISSLISSTLCFKAGFFYLNIMYSSSWWTGTRPCWCLSCSIMNHTWTTMWDCWTTSTWCKKYQCSYQENSLRMVHRVSLVDRAKQRILTTSIDVWWCRSGRYHSKLTFSVAFHEWYSPRLIASWRLLKETSKALYLQREPSCKVGSDISTCLPNFILPQCTYNYNLLYRI